MVFHNCAECYERTKVFVGKYISMEAISVKVAQGLCRDDDDVEILWLQH